MPYSLRPLLKGLPISLFLFLATGCRQNPGEVPDDYKSYQFDLKVIEKLPVYDSLASAILEKFAFFQPYIKKEDSYRAYRYMPLSDQADVFKKLPPETAPGIDQYFTKLGKDLIYGFDVFKDSTLKIYIRNNPSQRSNVDIQENLSYYPAGSKIRRRESPVRDTVLNEHWQYWTRFNKRGLF